MVSLYTSFHGLIVYSFFFINFVQFWCVCVWVRAYVRACVCAFLNILISYILLMLTLKTFCKL